MGTLMESWLPRHRITVHDYHRMAEVGVLAADAHVELIEGEIIDMAPIGMSHISVVDQLAHILFRALGDRAITRIQSSISLSQLSEPEPDIAVLKPRHDYYRHALATGADALLIIEVSDSTLRYDREVKVPLYARHNVPEVWIVDLENGRLLTYGSPTGGKYAREAAIERPGVLPLAPIPNVAIDLSNLLEP